MTARTIRGPDVVSVPRETYERLLRESALLMGLKACGVAQWEGYRDGFRLATPAYGCAEPDDYLPEGAK
jgi:hypothetical protein